MYKHVLTAYLTGGGHLSGADVAIFLQKTPLLCKKDLLLHTFRLPPLLIRRDYADLTAYFAEAAAGVLNDADKAQSGISRDELLHNLVFGKDADGEKTEERERMGKRNGSESMWNGDPPSPAPM